ncbi:MAG: 8-amino-7-oxononanoate synthase [Flavobacteriales bacterium]|nr:8-amino-7-oxononanoate synthase [Flavobacteriales bacterium]|tara:strand:- start:1074 stop:2315 length:1242 start_codon:yes stop_codon:yes gene_type:complete
MDLFEKIKKNRGPLGQHAKDAHGYFTFPKLEGEIASKMIFNNKEVICWSINNYLGLSNHPEVRKADADAAKKFGLGTPMGSRMMSGDSLFHEQLEKELAEFSQKEDAILLNFGYQGMHSAIDALVDRQDVIVYDSESHACILDGVRLHLGKRYQYPHNNIEKLKKQLERATNIINETGGSILVITEGVFGMAGDLGKLKEICALKQEFSFRLFVDDAHGVGTMGHNGIGTGEHFGVQDQIDVYFGTFAKSFASIGAFISSNKDVIEYLKYNTRSQIFAKSLPMPIVVGALKRLEIIRRDNSLKKKLWAITDQLQNGLRENGFNLGDTQSCVTPVFLSGGVGEATNLTVDLRENYGIFCSIVTYPVVPKGVIMLRLIPTATHTNDDVKVTINAFKEVKEKLFSGTYVSDKIAQF